MDHESGKATIHAGRGISDDVSMMAIVAILVSLWMHEPLCSAGSLACMPHGRTPDATAEDQGHGRPAMRRRLCRPRGRTTERSDGMSLGEIAYEAYHAALQEYRRTHHDQFDPAGRWSSLSPQFQAAWEAASHAVASVVVDRLRDAEA